MGGVGGESAVEETVALLLWNDSNSDNDCCLCAVILCIGLCTGYLSNKGGNNAF